jgi:hypothetical protein
MEFLTDRLYFSTANSARKEIVLNDGTNLTATRVPFCTTNGRLTDVADMTFATDTLTITKVSSGSFLPTSTQSTVNGSVSGNAVFSQPFQGSSHKRVIIYLTALNGTASYTYPTAFSKTPQATSQALAALVTTISTTAVTITGATSTGFIELSGY